MVKVETVGTLVVVADDSTPHAINCFPCRTAGMTNPILVFLPDSTCDN